MRPSYLSALRPLLAVLALAAPLAGCRGQTSEEAPIAALRNMWYQPKILPQQHSAFYADGRATRPPVEGTVARQMEAEPELATGRSADGREWVLTIPDAALERAGGFKPLLDRGQGRYGIYCTPCHDGTGAGKGMVIQRAGVAAFAPPSFHDERLRSIPDGQLFATITNGFGNMPAYRASIPVQDRWAIVAYVRALQLSQANTGSVK